MTSATPKIPDRAQPATWDQIYEGILGKICIHCHMQPESNNDDGGAGNNGGLGYAGVRLELETYEGVKRGLFRDGRWISILKPERPGEPPLILAALLRRHQEARRDFRLPYADAPLGPKGTDAARPGMPLGLPPLSVEQISLIKSWLAAGAPGPVDDSP